jgi:glycosyltransferase involved in cell wall biosynthesis
MFLHAGMDLYENQIYLRQKLLYADNIIVVCEFNRQFIYNYYKDISHLISDKITTYHLGLDFAELPYEVDNRSTCKVLAVGRLEKYKGFDYLLLAAHDLRCRGINCEVEFIGDGTEAGLLRALAKKLQIQEKVRFLGWLRFEDVRDIMRKATILVHPSNGLGDAVPTVIKESMALGTPVVASDVAGIPELLDHGRCGVLVPPRDVNALANAVEMMLMNASLRRSYADVARKYAEEKFDLWRNGQRLADLLRSTKRLEWRNST